MAKIPKYELKEREAQSLESSAEKAMAKYAIQKKVNKLSNYRLLQLFIECHLSKKDLEQIYIGDSRREAWVYLCERWDQFRKIPHFIEVICHVLNVSDDFISIKANAVVLFGISKYYNKSIRPIKSWKPKRKSPLAQRVDLLSYLFIRYEVPVFLYYNFDGEMEVASSLFIHLGSGLSFKKFDLGSLGITLTPKAYQYLFTVPNDFNFYQGLRWAQIHAMGGDKHLFNAIMQSHLRNQPDKRAESFWITVIQFFVNHPMIDSQKIPEIIDYISHQRFGHGAIIRGQRLQAEIADPEFNMKGRTPTSLIRQSDIWHQRLVKAKGTGYQYWEGAKIADYYDFDSEGKEKYKIIQLFNSTDLREEGARMHHCVGSYVHSCVIGRAAIFSLRDSNGGRILTIECNGKSIVQIRGKQNKRAESWMINIINDWAGKENLTISRWAI